MTEVIVVCEGQSEEAFVNDVLDQALSAHGVCVQPRLVATSRHSSGGALTGHRVLNYLRKTLRERQDTDVTTFFDLYGLPSDFPGQAVADSPADPVERAKQIEDGFHGAVVREVGCRPDRFSPTFSPMSSSPCCFPRRRASRELNRSGIRLLANWKKSGNRPTAPSTSTMDRRRIRRHGYFVLFPDTTKCATVWPCPPKSESSVFVASAAISTSG